MYINVWTDIGWLAIVYQMYTRNLTFLKLQQFSFCCWWLVKMYNCFFSFLFFADYKGKSESQILLWDGNEIALSALFVNWIVAKKEKNHPFSIVSISFFSNFLFEIIPRKCLSWGAGLSVLERFSILIDCRATYITIC